MGRYSGIGQLAVNEAVYSEQWTVGSNSRKWAVSSEQWVFYIGQLTVDRGKRAEDS